MRSVTEWGGLRHRLERIPSWAYDLAIALGITAIGLILGHYRLPEGWAEGDLRSTLLTCAVNLPLALRRRAPLTVCLGVLAVWTGYVALDYWPVVNALGPLVALHNVAAMRPLREATGCALLLAAVWGYAGTTGNESSWVTVLGQSLVYSYVICGFGILARKAARRSAQLAALAEQLRAERAGAERRAVAEERVRIARELHDVVAHHMSVISVQAGLADYVFRSDPDTARGALGAIGDASGEALTELRRLLAVLRVEEGDRPAGGPHDGAAEAGSDAFFPAPGLDRLTELAERVRAAGLSVEVTVTGERRALASGVDQCAYRVVQEALTNVLKHAFPAVASVTVDYRPGRLDITVTDDGPPGARRRVPVPAGGAGGGDGHGLIGMRERARIYGGRLRAGPRATGGFEVRLTLPA